MTRQNYQKQHFHNKPFKIPRFSNIVQNTLFQSFAVHEDADGGRNNINKLNEYHGNKNAFDGCGYFSVDLMGMNRKQIRLKITRCKNDSQTLYEVGVECWVPVIPRLIQISNTIASRKNLDKI